MKKSVLNQKAATTWKGIRPWVSFIVLLLVLRYTGILAGVSVFASSTLMDMGLMQAKPIAPTETEYLDYNFTIKDVNGAKVDFNTFKGKIIFINLWATWCGPCRAEMPSIQKLYDKMDNQKIAFVMLSIDDETNLRKVKKYIESNEYTFPTYMAGQLPVSLNVDVIPTTFVVAADGKIVHKKTGMSDYNSSKFKEFMDDLIKSTP